MDHAAVQQVHSSLIGQSAPDVVLEKTDGKLASVVGSRQGKKAILVFWATWCPHCYEDFTAINDHIASAEQNGIKIILVDIGETKEAVKNYLARRQMNLVSFVNEDSYLQGVYHIVGVPTLFFIDEKGIIRHVTHAFPPNYQDLF